MRICFSVTAWAKINVGVKMTMFLLLVHIYIGGRWGLGECINGWLKSLRLIIIIQIKDLDGHKNLYVHLEFSYILGGRKMTTCLIHYHVARN